MDNLKLYDANDDILRIMYHLKSIGWDCVKKQSIQRILYLTKVLYSFTHKDKNIFEYYSFSVTIAGPYSFLIENSLVYLKSNQNLLEDSDGNIKYQRESPNKDIDKEKDNWIKNIIFILGKYGENKIFGFTINDPLYHLAVQINQQKELDTSSPDNKTIQTLNNFKSAFEETLSNTSSIDDNEYIDLYFEYIFSQIIKN